MREKRNRGQDKSEPLFEYNLDIFDSNESLTVDFSDIPASEISKYTSAAKQESLQAARGLKLISTCVADENNSQASPEMPHNEDPLGVDMFIGHHRRMEREERRMQLLERQQLIIAASKVKTQKELLLRSDWKSQIGKIVKINNPSDNVEMSRKRDLAIKEMSEFLIKFDENNRSSRREQNPPKKKKPPKKSKTQHKPTQKPSPPPLPKYTDFLEPGNPPSISIRPYAFGHMLPKRNFPPTEFALPKLIHLEVETYDMIEQMKKEQPKDNT